MFEMGDHVVYHHDVCKVVGYEENYIDEDDYLVLEALFQPAMKFYVPVRSLDLLLRPVMSRKQALELIDSIDATEPLAESVIDEISHRAADRDRAECRRTTSSTTAIAPM